MVQVFDHIQRKKDKKMERIRRKLIIITRTRNVLVSYLLHKKLLNQTLTQNWAILAAYGSNQFSI